jgi:hypothetical protein
MYGSYNDYKPGVWRAICDVCGFKFKSFELRERWDGFMVCSKDWETRHPQDFVKDKPARALPWTRPEGPDRFVSVSYISTSVGTQDTTIPTGTNNNSL